MATQGIGGSIVLGSLDATGISISAWNAWGQDGRWSDGQPSHLGQRFRVVAGGLTGSVC